MDYNDINFLATLDPEKKLPTFGKQLDNLKNAVNKYTSLNPSMLILEPLVNSLKLQVLLSSSEDQASLLASWQLASIGFLTTESSTGFIGPSLKKISNGFIELLEILIPNLNVNQMAILKIAFQLAELMSVYISTDLLGRWNEIFKEFDQADVQKGGSFFCELGLIYIAGTEIIYSFFQLICEAIKLNGKNQEFVSHIGLLNSLFTLIFATEIESKSTSTILFSSLQPHLSQTLTSILTSLKQKESLSGQLLLMKIALDNQDLDFFKSSLDETLKNLNLSLEELEKDLKSIHSFEKILIEGIKNAFTTIETTTTTIQQSA